MIVYLWLCTIYFVSTINEQKSEFEVWLQKFHSYNL